MTVGTRIVGWPRIEETDKSNEKNKKSFYSHLSYASRCASFRNTQSVSGRQGEKRRNDTWGGGGMTMEVDPALDQPQRFVSRRWVHPLSAEPRNRPNSVSSVASKPPPSSSPLNLVSNAWCAMMKLTQCDQQAPQSPSHRTPLISPFQGFFAFLSAFCFASCLLRLQLFDLSDHPSTQICTSVWPGLDRLSD